MVRLGLAADDEDDASSDEDVEVLSERMQAPGEDDELQRRPRASSSSVVVYSPGGLFSSPKDMAIDEKRRGVLGGRETMGLAAQLGLGADASSRAAASLASPMRRATPPRTKPGSSTKKAKYKRARSIVVDETPTLYASSATETSKILERVHQSLGGESKCESSHRADFGLFMGRGFRASISPDGKKVARPVLGNFGRVSVRDVKVATVPEEALRVALDSLEPSGSRGRFPVRSHRPNKRYLAKTADDYARAYRNFGDNAIARHWDLVKALWFSAPWLDDDDDRDGGDRDVEMIDGPPAVSMGETKRSSRSKAVARDSRYEAVCSWLAIEARSSESKMRESDGGDGDDDRLDDSAPLAVVYRDVARRLCRRDVEGAAERCIEGGETRLALSIASTSGVEARRDVVRDFEASAERATDAGRALLARALGLAAGRLDLEDQIFVEQDDNSDDSENRLSWTTRLGLHVWYEREGSAPLSDALDSYYSAFSRGAASPPLADPSKRELARAYRLLHLARQDSKQFGDVATPPDDSVYAACLSPFAAGPGRLAGDVASSWHLHLVLDALCVNNRSRNRIICAKLADALVFQLAASGQGEWCLLVIAASFHDPAVRCRLARRVLDRRIADGTGVAPDAWVEASDALLAGIQGTPSAHVAGLVGASDFASAHAAMLASDQPARAVFVDKIALFRPLLETLDAHLKGDAEWESGAKLYLDFVRYKEDSMQVEESGEDGASQRRGNGRMYSQMLHLKEKIERAGNLPIQESPPLLAAGVFTHKPHLRAACLQHLGTSIALDQLHTNDDAPSPKKKNNYNEMLDNLDDLSRLTTLAPSAKLALMDQLALLFEDE